MKTSALKKEIHLAIKETKDSEILEAVYTILRKAPKEDENFDLTPDELKELDRRWNGYKNDKSRTYSLDEAKKEIRKKIKSAR